MLFNWRVILQGGLLRLGRARRYGNMSWAFQNSMSWWSWCFLFLLGWRCPWCPWTTPQSIKLHYVWWVQNILSLFNYRCCWLFYWGGFRRWIGPAEQQTIIYRCRYTPKWVFSGVRRPVELDPCAYSIVWWRCAWWCILIVQLDVLVMAICFCDWCWWSREASFWVDWKGSWRWCRSPSASSRRISHLPRSFTSSTSYLSFIIYSHHNTF